MAAFAYQCCKCSHRAINQEALELHEKFHPDVYNGRVFLSQQKKTFSGQGPDSKDGLMCKFIGCDFSCSRRDTKSMENHQSNIHFSHKVYDLSHELQVLAHVEKKEVGGEPKFQCGFCHRSFAEPRGCKVHILKSHLGKKLRCLYCPTEESFVGDLKRHVLVSHLCHFFWKNGLYCGFFSFGIHTYLAMSLLAWHLINTVLLNRKALIPLPISAASAATGQSTSRLWSCTKNST